MIKKILKLSLKIQDEKRNKNEKYILFILISIVCYKSLVLVPSCL